jgi:hypothetical protein
MRSLIGAFALVALAVAHPAKAAELAPQEKGYIGLIFAASRFVAKCEGFEMVPESELIRVRDRNGVSDKIGVATAEALKMIDGPDASALPDAYDRALLIPEVTRYLGIVRSEMLHEIGEKDFCRGEWLNVLMGYSIIHTIH